MTTKEAEKLEPFKPPFRVMAVRENGAAIGCVVTDFNRREISIVMPEHYAQWLCARLNATHPAPTADEPDEQEWIACAKCRGEGWSSGGNIYDAAGGIMDSIEPEECDRCKGRGQLRLVDIPRTQSPAASDYIRQTLKVKP